MRLDRRELTFEPEHAGGDQCFLREEAGVVDQEASREIIRAIEHDVVLRDERDDIVGIDQLVIRVDGNFRIDGGERLLSGLDFWFSERGSRVHDLSLEIRKIDNVPIDETDRPDTGRSEIESSRRSQTTGTDQQDLGPLELQLALATHILKDDVPAVPLNF